MNSVLENRVILALAPGKCCGGIMLDTVQVISCDTVPICTVYMFLSRKLGMNEELAPFCKSGRAPDFGVTESSWCCCAVVCPCSSAQCADKSVDYLQCWANLRWISILRRADGFGQF